MERWERLLEELRSEFLLREEELELLHAIDLQLLETERPLGSSFEFIVRGTQELLRSDHTHILLRRGRYLEPAYSTKETDIGQRIEIAASLTGQCLTNDSTINIPDVTVEPYIGLYIPIRGYTGPPMRSLVAAPIRVHETMVGVLNAESTREHAFGSVHVNALTAVAAQVGIALQRSQLFDRNQLFSEVDQLIFADADSPQVIQTALQKVMKALQDLEHIRLSGAQILFRRGTDELEIVHSTNPSDIGLVLRNDESICGRAVRERKTITIGDVSSEPKYLRMLGSAIRSEIAVPILLGDDNVVIGVLNVESEDFDTFQGFYQVILESFSDKVRTLLAFAKLRSDVTDAMELRNANDLLVAVGDQASNMVHRLNNTVGAMRLRLIELEELYDSGEMEGSPFLLESLHALRQLAERTLQMPEDVTQLLSQEGSTVDVNAAVRTALEKLQLPSNVTVRTDLAPDIPSLSLYCFDIVIENLLQNALDAMPYGGVLSVSTASILHPELTTGYVQLTVVDSGTGIPKDILANIFDLNFSTKSGKGKGLGLGLWWIRNFVRRAKGDITVSSTDGSGTEFAVKIPFDRPVQSIGTTSNEG